MIHIRLVSGKRIKHGYGQNSLNDLWKAARCEAVTYMWFRIIAVVTGAVAWISNVGLIDRAIANRTSAQPSGAECTASVSWETGTANIGTSRPRTDRALNGGS